jgi:hypothetical protein
MDSRYTYSSTNYMFSSINYRFVCMCSFSVHAMSNSINIVLIST